MRILRWFDEHLESALAAALLAVIVAFISAQIFMRYVFNSPLSWTEEAVLWTFVWFIWIGISYAFKERRHVRVTVFVDLFPQGFKKAVEMSVDVLIVIFFIVLTWHSYKLITLPYVLAQKSVVLNMPIAFLYMSAPVGALLSVFRVSQHILRTIVPAKLQNHASANS